MTPLCIYHADCLDGLAAAYAVRKYYAEQHREQIEQTGLDEANFGAAIDFLPAEYGHPAPDATGRYVIIVDFSYHRDELIALASRAQRILIIDHHKSARKHLQDLPANVHAIFDTGRSASMIAWNFLFPGVSPPLLYDHIQDNDLGQWKLPTTRAIIDMADSYLKDFSTFKALTLMPSTVMHAAGRHIGRYRRQIIDQIIANRRTFLFGALRIPVANCPRAYRNEVGAQLANGHPFAATYYDDAYGRKWSLRSAPDGANVADVAEFFGGGGHEHSAGFRQTWEQAREFEMTNAEVR